MTKLPDNYLALLAQIESSNNPLAKAATSTGSGLYQFLRATWIGEGGAWGPDPGKAFGGLKPTRDEQSQRAKTFTTKNAVALAKAGVGVNNATLYAAHFLGVGTALKLLKATSTARADWLAGAGPTKANPSILQGKTVAQFLAWLKAKTGVWAR